MAGRHSAELAEGRPYCDESGLRQPPHSPLTGAGSHNATTSRVSSPNKTSMGHFWESRKQTSIMSPLFVWNHAGDVSHVQQSLSALLDKPGNQIDE